MTSRRLALSLVAAIAVASGQVPSLSGKWQLNVEKSSWGKHPKPTSATVLIEHQEPSFKYSGAVEVQKGTETPDGKSFAFEGAIDGKEYPVKGSGGMRMMTIRRVNATTTVSELKSNDGSMVETAKMSISADGKRLTRELTVHGPGKDLSWTEVYDRQ